MIHYEFNSLHTTVGKTFLAAGHSAGCRTGVCLDAVRLANLQKHHEARWGVSLREPLILKESNINTIILFIYITHIFMEKAQPGESVRSADSWLPPQTCWTRLQWEDQGSCVCMRLRTSCYDWVTLGCLVQERCFSEFSVHADKLQSC